MVILTTSTSNACVPDAAPVLSSPSGGKQRARYMTRPPLLEETRRNLEQRLAIQLAGLRRISSAAQTIRNGHPAPVTYEIIGGLADELTASSMALRCQTSATR